jgi:hypothetical protein
MNIDRNTMSRSHDGGRHPASASAKDEMQRPLARAVPQADPLWDGGIGRARCKRQRQQEPEAVPLGTLRRWLSPVSWQGGDAV